MVSGAKTVAVRCRELWRLMGSMEAVVASSCALLIASLGGYLLLATRVGLWRG